jgi:hypothetical protein
MRASKTCSFRSIAFRRRRLQVGLVQGVLDIAVRGREPPRRSTCRWVDLADKPSYSGPVDYLPVFDQLGEQSRGTQRRDTEQIRAHRQRWPPERAAQYRNVGCPQAEGLGVRRGCGQRPIGGVGTDEGHERSRPPERTVDPHPSPPRATWRHNSITCKSSAWIPA